MYPAIPIGTVAGGHLARTGVPVASFLIVATVLLVLGLLFLRASMVVRHDEV